MGATLAAGRPAVRISAVLGAVLAVAVLAGAGWSFKAGLGAAEDLSRAREDATRAGTSQLARDVLYRLVDERNYASVYMLGSENVVALPVDSVAESSAATDDALAALRASVEHAGDEVARTYGPALAEIDAELAALRGAVNGMTGPRDQNQAAATAPVYDGYVSLIDGMLTADNEFATTLRNGDAAQGAQLINVALRQNELRGRVIRSLLLAGIGPGGTPTAAQASELTRDRAALVANDARLAELATGDYRAPAGELAAAAPIDPLTAVVDDALTAPVVNVAAALESSPRPDPYPDFEHSVEGTVTASLADSRHEAETRRLVWFGLAAAAVLSLAVTLVVLRR
jgi:hypothetical protein